ncbi:hypothetical protein JCGZ_22736 [Jatropha curcas]|uniref:Uncharacterized protein n=1 Tax=Jatropha curcas TaxID=180498 RepID=A0A067LGA3_JATCU|nr:hypothetical protein JCGZ_22736 [Jatropha curcas]
MNKLRVWHGHVEGAVFEAAQLAGYDVYFEDEEGRFIRALSGFYEGTPVPDNVEVLALRFT